MRFIRDIKAFTLIEMILTIVLTGIIAGVSAKILLSGLDTYTFIVNRKDATQHARVGMERMVSELNLIEWSDLTWMGNDHLGFVDQDGVATSFKKTIQNEIPTLYRGNDLLAGQLGFVDFDYLKADGSSASFNWDVKRINIELSITSLGGHGEITLRTEVFPRNMMYTNFQ